MSRFYTVEDVERENARFTTTRFILDNENLSCYDKMLYVVLCSYDHKVPYNTTELAKAGSMSVRSVQKSMKTLQAAGLIIRTENVLQILEVDPNKITSWAGGAE